jgi:hypothetical protein
MFSRQSDDLHHSDQTTYIIQIRQLISCNMLNSLICAHICNICSYLQRSLHHSVALCAWYLSAAQCISAAQYIYVYISVWRMTDWIYQMHRLHHICSYMRMTDRIYQKHHAHICNICSHLLSLCTYYLLIICYNVTAIYAHISLTYAHTISLIYATICSHLLNLCTYYLLNICYIMLTSPLFMHILSP